MEATSYKQIDTDVILRFKRKPVRFKAGSDLQTRVNRISMDIDEETTEQMDMIKLKIEVFRESCVESSGEAG
jgi:hypothetical protein